MTDRRGPESGSGSSGMTGSIERQAQSALERGKAVAEDAQKTAGAVASDMRAEVESAAEQHKGALVSVISDVADAVQSVASQLRQRQQPEVAEYADSVGSGLSSISRSLDQKRPADLVGDVTRFAHSNPAAFLGGALVVGMALGRFAKASAPSSGPSSYSGQSSYGSQHSTTQFPGR